MSALEEALILQLIACQMPLPAREVRFAPPRRWRFDLYYDTARLAVEIEGGAWVGGRHNRPMGFEADMRKYNEASCRGIRVLRVTGTMIKSGEALTWIERALEERVA